ncbi:helix-turn-helix domain-containing protein [Pirellulales bacterium]|nr:helix-turn-helix domain-containing protein [Pirellulales bacterium]
MHATEEKVAEEKERIAVCEREAAAMLSVSVKTLFNQRRAGNLKAVRVGHAIRYRLTELERFAAANER